MFYTIHGKSRIISYQGIIQVKNGFQFGNRSSKSSKKDTNMQIYYKNPNLFLKGQLDNLNNLNINDLAPKNQEQAQLSKNQRIAEIRLLLVNDLYMIPRIKNPFFLKNLDKLLKYKLEKINIINRGGHVGTEKSISDMNIYLLDNITQGSIIKEDLKKDNIILLDRELNKYEKTVSSLKNYVVDYNEFNKQDYDKMKEVSNSFFKNTKKKKFYDYHLCGSDNIDPFSQLFCNDKVLLFEDDYDDMILSILSGGLRIIMDNSGDLVSLNGNSYGIPKYVGLSATFLFNLWNYNWKNKLSVPIGDFFILRLGLHIGKLGFEVDLDLKSIFFSSYYFLVISNTVRKIDPPLKETWIAKTIESAKTLVAFVYYFLAIGINFSIKISRFFELVFQYEVHKQCLSVILRFVVFSFSSFSNQKSLLKQRENEDALFSD